MPYRFQFEFEDRIRGRDLGLYVNGDLEATDTLGYQVMLGNPENDMLIGNGDRLIGAGDTTLPYVGYISQVAFFDVPLEEREVQGLYDTTFAPSKASKNRYR